MNSPQENINRQVLPITLSVLANLILGSSSLYWRALGDVTPTTLVAYRIILSAFILSICILVFRPPHPLKILRPRTVLRHFFASLFIAANWATFIWSSINGYILETGLGYLLAPFISIALGIVIYQEPISIQKTASLLTTLGCIALFISLTENINHSTYLLIAITWGLYTYTKKSTPLTAVNGLFIETVLLTLCLPPAFLLFNLTIPYPHELPPQSSNIIWLAGAVSTVPLFMFSYATGKIPLSLTGALQLTLPLTLITISLTSEKQNMPTTSLITLITTIIILGALITYDTTASRQPKKRSRT